MIAVTISYLSQFFLLCDSGDREIDESFRTTSVSMDDNLATIVDTLRYSFAPSDHGQQVRCVTAGSWIVVGQDEYDAYAQLDVMCKLISWPIGIDNQISSFPDRFDSIHFDTLEFK